MIGYENEWETNTNFVVLTQTVTDVLKRLTHLLQNINAHQRQIILRTARLKGRHQGFTPY